MVSLSPAAMAATLTFHHNGRDISVDFPTEQAARDWWGERDSFDATIAKKMSLADVNAMFERENATEA